MVDLLRALTWHAVVGVGRTMVTECGGGAPASCARHWSLPAWLRKRLRARRDGGIMEEQLRWQMGGSTRACAGYGNGGGGEGLGYRCGRGRSRENANGAHGAVQAGAGEVKARVGLPLPCWVGRQRRVASHWFHAAREAYRWSATESLPLFDSVRDGNV